MISTNLINIQDLKIIKMQLLCSFVALMVVVNVQTANVAKNQNDLIKTSFSRSILKSCAAEDPNNLSMKCYAIKMLQKVIQHVLNYIVEPYSAVNRESISALDSSNNNTIQQAKTVNGTSLVQLLKNKNYSIGVNNAVYSRKKTKDIFAVTARLLGGGGGMMDEKGNMMLMNCLLLGLGLLTMKSLVASAIALLLSVMMAFKKHHGHEVVYSDHRRRRYSVDHELGPYRGWPESTYK